MLGGAQAPLLTMCLLVGSKGGVGIIPSTLNPWRNLADPEEFESPTSAFGVGSFTVVHDLDDLQLFELSALSVARGDALLIYDLRPSALSGYPVVTPEFGADN
jgi:hypothetical protein